MCINRGIDKEDVIHKYSGILCHEKNKIIPSAATWMELEIVVLSEVNQTQRDTCYMISHILYDITSMQQHGWNYRLSY